MLMRREYEKAVRAEELGLALEPPPGWEWTGRVSGSIIPVGAREECMAPYRDISMRSVPDFTDDQKAAYAEAIAQLCADGRREYLEKADVLQGVLDGEYVIPIPPWDEQPE